MKVLGSLKQVIHEATEEVKTWPAWLRSPVLSQEDVMKSEIKLSEGPEKPEAREPRKQKD